MVAALLIAFSLQATNSSATAQSASESAPGSVAEAAGPVATRSKPTFACVRDGSTPEINACLADDLAEEEARMERYLMSAREQARASDEASRSFGGPSAQRGYLAASQAAWVAYARMVCEGVDDSFKDGSIHTAMFLGCMIELTHERTRVIWRNHLTHSDSTPPILPEPIETAAGN